MISQGIFKNFAVVAFCYLFNSLIKQCYLRAIFVQTLYAMYLIHRLIQSTAVQIDEFGFQLQMTQIRRGNISNKMYRKETSYFWMSNSLRLQYK